MRFKTKEEEILTQRQTRDREQIDTFKYTPNYIYKF